MQVKNYSDIVEKLSSKVLNRIINKINKGQMRIKLYVNEKAFRYRCNIINVQKKLNDTLNEKQLNVQIIPLENKFFDMINRSILIIDITPISDVVFELEQPTYSDIISISTYDGSDVEERKLHLYEHVKDCINSYNSLNSVKKTEEQEPFTVRFSETFIDSLYNSVINCDNQFRRPNSTIGTEYLCA